MHKKECAGQLILNLNKEDGFKGKVLWLPTDKVDVDHAYQRDPVKDATIKTMAADFDREACGVITVVTRAGDRMYYAIDGQERLLAAKLAGKEHVLCLLLPPRTLAEEAKLYRKINSDRTQMMAVQRHKAAVVEGREPEVSIDAYLSKIGLVARSDSQTPGVVAAASAVRGMWLKNEEATKRALQAAKAICANCPMHNHIIRGLWLLECDGMAVGEHVPKLVRAGGGNAIVALAASVKAEALMRISSGEASRIAIMRLIKKRTKTSK